MKRKLSKDLEQWRLSPARKPLVLMGARQVGKTYTLKEFADQHYKNLVSLNFDLNRGLSSIFEADLDPKRIIRDISLQTNSEIIPGETLIFFDEVQECPNALISLKYFNELANEYHICAAGSLLGVKLLNTKGFPVGKVNLFYLYPLDFSEFLIASGEIKLAEYLENVSIHEQVSSVIHEKLLALFKIYMITGGMPEAIKTYFADSNQSLTAVRKTQQMILNTYNLDFSKHAPANMIMKILQVWNSIPSQLVKENKKFIYSVLRQGARAKDFEDAIQWLVEADLICKTYNITAPNLPISAYCNYDIFKLYLFDVGLYGAIANLDPAIIIHGDELFVEFKGSIAETYVAQALHMINAGNAIRDLYYWTSPGKAEVDFIIQVSNQIYPLEVKSGLSSKQKSLAVYTDKYKPKFVLRTSTQNLKLTGELLNIPLYLMFKLPAIVEQLAELSKNP